MLLLYFLLKESQAPEWMYLAAIILTILWIAAPTKIFREEPGRLADWMWGVESLLIWPAMLVAFTLLAIGIVCYCLVRYMADGFGSLVRAVRGHFRRNPSPAA